MPIIPRDRVDEVVQALLDGDVVAIPTDTVYGLAATLDHSDAVRRLAELKGRAADQPIAVLLATAEDATPHLADANALETVTRFWPGALTAIVRVKQGFADVVTTDAGTLGLRIPDDALARSVIRACGGALAVTSANFHGEEPARSAQYVAEAFGESMLVLDGGTRNGGVASTVVDLSVEPPQLLREGGVSREELGLSGAG